MFLVSCRPTDLDQRKYRFGGRCNDQLRLWSWRADCLLTGGIRFEKISWNLCERRAVLQQGDQKVKGMFDRIHILINNQGLTIFHSEQELRKSPVLNYSVVVRRPP